MIQNKLDDLKRLVSELEQSKEYESKTYHLFRDKAVDGYVRFYLYRIANKKQLCYGTMERINSYMNLRGINFNNVLTER